MIIDDENPRHPSFHTDDSPWAGSAAMRMRSRNAPAFRQDSKPILSGVVNSAIPRLGFRHLQKATVPIGINGEKRQISRQSIRRRH
jgi:hypothetical protein